MKFGQILFAGIVASGSATSAFAQIGGDACADRYRAVPFGATLDNGPDNGPDDGGQIDGAITVVGSLGNSLAECTETKTELPARDAYGLAGRIEQRIAVIAGLQQFRRSDSRSSNPTSQGVTLRGLGGNAASRALVFIDDVPQADPFGGWVAWPGFDALNLRGVRVRKGAGQASAGPGAISGVIELESVQRLRGRDDSITLGYGSRNSVEARGRTLAWLGGGNLSLSGSYSRGDGFIPIIANQRGTVDRAAGYEQGGAALRFVVPVAAETDLQASLRGFTDDRNRGFDFSDSSNSGVDGSIRLVKHAGDWQASVTAYAQLREFSSQFGAVSADRSVVTPTLDQFAVPSSGVGVRFELRPPVGEAAELRIGGEWRRALGETRENFTFVAGAPTRLRTAGGLTDSYGLFAEASFRPADNVTISAGGRIDRWAIRDGFRREINIGGTVRSDDRFTDRAGTEPTARIGAAWALNDAWRVKASAYTGWRLPTLNELYRPFRVGADATAANETLSPERIKGTEASLSFGEDKSLHADITLFYNQLDDAIANVSIARGPGLFPGVGFVAASGTFRQRQNLAGIVSKGIEFDVRLPIGDNFGIGAAYSFIDAKTRVRLGAAAVGPRPAQVPKHFANISADYGDDGNFQASVNIRYVGSQFEDDGNSRLLADALTADALISHRLTGGLRAELRGENLFDAQVDAAVSGAGIIERANPRTMWLSLQWGFN